MDKFAIYQKYNKQSAEYRTLKFSWRLYLKSAENLDEKQLFYDRHLRKQLTQLERVEKGLAVSPEVKASYESMQNITKSLKDHDKDGIVDYLYNT